LRGGVRHARRIEFESPQFPESRFHDETARRPTLGGYMQAPVKYQNKFHPFYLLLREQMIADRACESLAKNKL